ncbi:MAG: PKD domain-containing protein, partial [Saprospiraceae bacterium]
DGHTSDGQNPSHTYAEPGVYLVCLIIEDGAGCVSDVCHEVPVEGTSSDCDAEFVWELIAGTYTIEFLSTSTSNSDIISYIWHFGDGHEGDGNNPSHTYAGPGTYNVCLIITTATGCVADVCHQVVVHAVNSECHAGFALDQIGNTLEIEFINQSTSEHDIVSYHWDFGDGHEGDGSDPHHTYSEPGTYEVCLTIEDAFGCVSEVCHAVVVEGTGEGCNAAFEWEPGDNNLVIHFINQSTSDHDIISYKWNFGDGHEGDGQNPSHTYAEPGIYLVCLIITDGAGCVSDVCHEVVVEGNSGECEAGFVWEAGLDNSLNIHFDDTSDDDPDIVSWHWTFGDGHSSDDQNPSHEYGEPGVYVVCLIVTNEFGCVADVCHEVHVELNVGDCHASFSWDQIEGSFGVQFINTSDDDPDNVSWQWNFGDGHTSDEENPSHEFDTAGTYLVCLIVTNEFGCVSDVCHEVHVSGNSEGCQAGFTWEQVDGQLAIHFNNTSTSEHDIISYHWSFGDGQNGDGQNPTHEYDHPGVYVVCLTIEDNTGCITDVCHEVVVEEVEEEGCHAAFDWEFLQDGLTVRFHSLSTSDHDIISFHWTFGDGHTGDTWNPLHTYDAPGVYVVCLTITDGAGCTNTICQEVHVEGESECHASFEFENIEDVYHFFNNSTGTTDHTTYFWEFGDGSSSTEENPEHQYEEDGTYIVCLFI